MYLQSAVFEDTEFHVQVGAPICLGVSLTPVTPAVADRFLRLCSAKTIDTNAATAHLIDYLRQQTREQATARHTLEKRVAEAKKMLEEAQRLAALPVTGEEVRTIKELISQTESVIGGPLPSTTRVDRLRRCLPVSIGLDVAAIAKAIDEFDAETALLRRAMEDLVSIRDGLVEAAKVATDPATLAGLDKVKVNVKLMRALTPERVAALQKCLDTGRSMLAEFESELAALAKAFQ